MSRQWSFEEKKLRGVSALLFDNDGVLAPYGDGVNEIYQSIIANAACQLGVPMTYEEARAAAKESYDRCGLGYDVFVREHGVCLRTIHHAVYDEMIKDEWFFRLVKKSEQTEKTRTLLQEVCEVHEIPVGILSHSSRPYLNRVTEYLGYAPFIPEENRFSLEDELYGKKNEDHRVFHDVASKMGFGLNEILFADDTTVNLHIPCTRLFMKVAQVGPFKGNGERECLPVDFCVRNVNELLEMFIAAKDPKPSEDFRNQRQVSSAPVRNKPLSTAQM